MIVVLYLVGIVAGAASALQSSVNGQLGSIVGPINAAVVSTLVGLVTLVSFGLVTRQLDITRWSSSPPHLLIGGALGALFVTSAIYLVPRLGVVSTVMLAVLGQLILAAVVDQFGLLGNPRIEVSVTRFAGIAMVAGGFLLARTA